jgi:hypothetical protein
MFRDVQETQFLCGLIMNLFLFLRKSQENLGSPAQTLRAQSDRIKIKLSKAESTWVFQKCCEYDCLFNFQSA